MDAFLMLGAPMGMTPPSAVTPPSERPAGVLGVMAVDTRIVLSPPWEGYVEPSAKRMAKSPRLMSPNSTPPLANSPARSSAATLDASTPPRSRFMEPTTPPVPNAANVEEDEEDRRQWAAAEAVCLAKDAEESLEREEEERLSEELLARENEERLSEEEEERVASQPSASSGPATRVPPPPPPAPSPLSAPRKTPNGPRDMPRKTPSWDPWDSKEESRDAPKGWMKWQTMAPEHRRVDEDRWHHRGQVWRPGVNGGDERYGGSGGKDRQYYHAFYVAKGLGKGVLAAFEKEFGHPKKGTFTAERYGALLASKWLRNKK